MPVIVNRTWYGRPIFHGPHRWTWWRRFKIRLSKVVYIQSPERALRIWMYTRKGSGFIEIVWSKK